MKHKGEVLSKFQQFKSLAENQSNMKIKALRSDNGGEYTGREFQKFCGDHGIERSFSSPYAPNQNGAAERLNRTLIEMVTSMLAASGIPSYLWGEALLSACYLKNLSPHSSVQGKTPEEAWSGRRPSVKHLKVFGCKASILLTPSKKTKFGSRVWWGSFVGYGGPSLGYRVWDPVKGQIFTRKNVKFFEQETYDYSKQQAESKNSTQYFLVDFDVHGSSSSSSIGDTNAVITENLGNGSDEPQAPIEEVEVEEPIVLRRSTRFRRPVQPLQRFGQLHHSRVDEIREPKTLKEALSGLDRHMWQEAIDEEMKSLRENKTWELVECPKGRNVIGCKFVFKVKKSADGSVERYKARLVAKGYTQERGIDYEETFAPVIKMQSLRALVALANERNAFLHQMDVKTAFLYGELDEELFMEQPEGQCLPGQEKLVCKLQKSLYGLKQSPRQWYSRLSAFFEKYGLVQIEADHAVYVSKSDPRKLFVGVYVDDLLIGSKDLEDMRKLKSALSEEFRMKDLGDVGYVLGIKITRSESSIFLSQEHYAKGLLSQFGMADCHGVMTPLETGTVLESTGQGTELCGENIPYREAVGSLMYLMTCTRPDLATAVSMVSRFLSAPRTNHWMAIKRIFRYVAQTISHGICYAREGDIKLIGYSDADWAGDAESRKSRSGYIFLLGGAAVSWQSKLQDIVALSSAEAEYIAAVESGKEAVWFRGFLQQLGEEDVQTELLLDNQSAIQLAKNPVNHRRSKHIETRYHKIREWVGNQVFDLKYIHTSQMAADFLTKNVNKVLLEKTKVAVGVKSLT
jgi:hypothetical protein